MATPDIILYSPLNDGVEDAIWKMRPVFERNEFRLVKISRLGWDPEENQFQYIGFDEPCANEKDAISIGSKWEGFVLAYDVDIVGQRIYLYFWSENGRDQMSVQITPEMLFFEEEDFPEGLWLQMLVLDVTAAVRADVAGYGPRYRDFVGLIDFEEIMVDLEAGDLSRFGFPSIHMVSSSVTRSGILREPQITSIVKGLRYFVTTTGYHVLSNLPCDRRP